MSYVVVVDFEHNDEYFVDGGIFPTEEAADDYALGEFTRWRGEYDYEIVKVHSDRYFQLEEERGFEWGESFDYTLDEEGEEYFSD